MKPWKNSDSFNFNLKDVALIGVWALANAAFGAYLIKRSYFDGWYDYKETFVDHQWKKRLDH